MKQIIITLGIVFALSCVTPVSAFTVSGHLTGGEGGFTLSYVYAAPTSLDTFYIGVGIPILHTYSILNMQEGSYILFAFQDLNTSLTPDLDEPRGFYGGTPPQFLVIADDSENVDIELQDPNSGGFTGTITYGGTNTGTTFVLAYRTPAFTDSIRGIGVLLTNEGNGAYTAFVDSFGVYYAYAFMDLNTNFQYDPEEPYGAYGGGTPSAINVQATDFPENVDIEMVDPNSAPKPSALLPLATGISEIYPNPFNGRATITFTLATPGSAELTLFDLLGQRITVLANGQYESGAHQVALSADGLPSGTYFIQLQTAEASAAQRLMILK